MKYIDMDQLIFIPVENLMFKDLYDWSIPIQRGNCNKVILPQNVCPKKRNVVILPKCQGKGCGSLTRANEKEIALFRYESKVYAVKEDCPHAGGPLHLGEIEDLGEETLCVKCPWHGWKIDLVTGKVKFPEHHDNQFTVVYKVKVTEEGRIFIGFNALDQRYFQIDENDF